VCAAYVASGTVGYGGSNAAVNGRESGPKCKVAGNGLEGIELGFWGITGEFGK